MSYHPIVKTEAVTLRINPFSNTSHVVTWLTPDFGKLSTVIKGACRPKRESAGEYDLGYRCELLFYEYARQGLHTFKECAAIDSRHHCRGDWRRTAVVSYLCHLAAAATPDGAHIPDLYHLTDNAIAILDSTPPPHDTLMLWFELKLLDLLGLPPHLEHCTLCKTRPTPEERVFFPASLGGVACEHCAAGRREIAAAPRLSGNTRMLLCRWQRAAAFAPLRTVEIETAIRQELCQSMRYFLPLHLETAPECRAIAFQMTAMQLKEQGRTPPLHG